MKIKSNIYWTAPKKQMGKSWQDQALYSPTKPNIHHNDLGYTVHLMPLLPLGIMVDLPQANTGNVKQNRNEAKKEVLRSYLL